MTEPTSTSPSTEPTPIGRPSGRVMVLIVFGVFVVLGLIFKRDTPHDTSTPMGSCEAAVLRTFNVSQDDVPVFRNEFAMTPDPETGHVTVTGQIDYGPTINFACVSTKLSDGKWSTVVTDTR